MKGYGFSIRKGAAFSWSAYWMTRNPENASATTTSDTTMTVTWDDPADVTADGIKIYLSTDGGANYTLKETVAYGVETKNLTGLTANTLYKVKVVSYKGSQISTGVTDDQRTLPSRNADIVLIGGYMDIAVATTNLNSYSTGRYYLVRNNINRIRSTGTLTKVRFFYKKSDETETWLQIWRKDGTTYDVVYEEEIRSKSPNGEIGEVTLAQTVNVIEGDLIGIGCDATNDGAYKGNNVGRANSLHYVNGARPGNNFAWETQSNLTHVIPIQSYGQAPLIVCIGDSIMAGHGLHYSYCEDSLTNNPDKAISGKLKLLNANYVCQNMGIGGEESTEIAARFTTDVVALKPKIVIINGGVNDLASSRTKASFIGAYTTILDACATAGIIPIVCKVMPWTNGTNTQMQTRDDWMDDLAALVATYSGAKFVDFDSALGQFRVGGDAGNFWDIKEDPDYNSDGVHFTEIGYAKIAELLDAAIRNS